MLYQPHPTSREFPECVRPHDRLIKASVGGLSQLILRTWLVLEGQARLPVNLAYVRRIKLNRWYYCRDRTLRYSHYLFMLEMLEWVAWVKSRVRDVLWNLDE